jgi:ABC-type transporter Mla maintaining outer membrane lipid asymmetry ATPase subunit MlaF
VIGAAWLLRSLARQPQLLATERPAAGFDPVLASRLVHVLGASLLVWLLAQTLLV